jgi:hypothetical protein
MATFDQAKAAIPKAKELIERMGGVMRDIIPEPDSQGWLLKVRTASPLCWPDVLRTTEIDQVKVVFHSDFDRPVANLPRTALTDKELLSLPRFRGRPRSNSPS